MDQKTKLAPPTLVKFKTGHRAGVIERVEALRETPAFVVLPIVGRPAGTRREYREAKRGEFAQYHDSWGEAHAHLMSEAQIKVNAARRSLELANAAMGNIKGMKPPKEGK
ncbi:hypothetical protein [Telluria beijingensis]|uniref:hypothetical protein n=1 Tax=Telluria beijingensis TaxID=3068633 RepID=UPI002795823E|nr:hypothetical protein [Massilia sp. REN29]